MRERAMTIRRYFLGMMVIAATSLVIPNLANAQNFQDQDWVVQDDGPIHRKMQVSVLGSLGYGVIGYFGGSLWFRLPIMGHGILPNVNDSISIEAGGSFGIGGERVAPCDYSHSYILPMGAARWDLQLLENWSVYSAFRLGPVINNFSTTCDAGFGSSEVTDTRIHLIGDVAFGSHYYLSEQLALRLDFGYRAISFGVSLSL